MKKQFFKTTRDEKERYTKAVRWLQKRYTREQIAEADMPKVIRPFCEQYGVHLGMDDMAIVFLVAEGKAEI